MRRILVSLSVAVSAIILATIGAQSVVQAGWSQDIKSGDTVTLAKGQTHEGSLYIAGNNVKIDGTVTGSLYCAGQNVTITGKVSGDVACAGQTLEYTGTTDGSVRLAGQQVTVNGAVGADTTLFGMMASVGEQAKLAGDLNGGAQTVTINGEVAKNLQYGAQSVTINGLVAGSANIGSDAISLGENARVAGSLHYTASKELSIDTDKVAGKIEYNAVGEESSQANPLAGLLMTIAMFIATALIIALAAPRFMERSSRLASARFGQTLLIGSATVFVTPFVIFVLFLGILTLPLAIVAVLLYIATLILSGVFLAYHLGALLLRSSQNVLVRMIGGVAVLVALWIIPIVNIFAILATVIVGSGILVRTLTNGYRAPRYSLTPEPTRPPMPTALGGKKELETPRPIAKKPAKPKKPADKK